MQTKDIELAYYFYRVQLKNVHQHNLIESLKYGKRAPSYNFESNVIFDTGNKI